MKELYSNTHEKLGTVKVLEQGDVRYLEVNGGCQGAYHTKNKYPLSRYIYNMYDMFSVHDHKKTDVNILMIGAGAMLLPNLLGGRNKITIVDCDPRVFSLIDHFDYDSKNATFLSMTGEAFLMGHKPQVYDYVFVDAYVGYVEDQFLYSLPGIKAVKNTLKDNGAMISNLISNPDLQLAGGVEDYELYQHICLNEFQEGRTDFLKPGIKDLRNVVGMYYGKA